MSRERKIDGEMGRWGDGNPPLTPPRRGIWEDGKMGRFLDICTIKCISYPYKYSLTTMN
ncbi:MAG: hypothetical protein F6K48_13805 [Okeania sp. SIO3H1]|uniref:hypothetical protein n=1 Tax=Okeania sp. SIO1I7 TaxID=2607772 RepID=UPI0013CC90F4|nr:hypothetical protein [Okeania sp. SIO1I7]NEN89922.1 hypothetical protein [Okeania sp. SIO3H1]NET26429.1 hypothetical protein [Okeania sp. SIO1I7]